MYNISTPRNRLRFKVAGTIRAETAAVLQRFRGSVVGALVSSIIHGVSIGSKLHPIARRQWREVEVLRDVPYCDSDLPSHRLDVYRPRERDGLLPGVLYLHGGGFRSVPKEVNWMMALGFAHRGYVVFNANYRLAPRDTFPAAHVDAAEAWLWMRKHAEEFGADPSRLIVAGDSAGANLALSLVISACAERPEPWAARVFEAGQVPLAAVLLCGLLELRDCERVTRLSGAGPAEVEQLNEIRRLYLGRSGLSDADLVDPLVLLERARHLARALPPMFASVGTRDPLISDTQRLARVLRDQGVQYDARYYEKAFHAFQAIIFRDDAQASWNDTHSFLAEVLETARSTPESMVSLLV